MVEVALKRKGNKIFMKADEIDKKLWILGGGQ